MEHNTINTHTRCDELLACARICGECFRTCSDTLSYCLEDCEKPPSKVATMLIDCMEVCQLSFRLLSRRSKIHTLSCAMCVEVCNRCAALLEQFDNERFTRCAEECRDCAESCGTMNECK